MHKSVKVHIEQLSGTSRSVVKCDHFVLFPKESVTLGTDLGKRIYVDENVNRGYPRRWKDGVE